MVGLKLMMILANWFDLVLVVRLIFPRINRNLVLPRINRKLILPGVDRNIDHSLLMVVALLRSARGSFVAGMSGVLVQIIENATIFMLYSGVILNLKLFGLAGPFGSDFSPLNLFIVNSSFISSSGSFF